MTAYKKVQDASAAELPLLPLRFGALPAREDAVAQELRVTLGGEHRQPVGPPGRTRVGG